MKINLDLFVLFLCMGIVTYLPRFFPLFLLSRKELPSLCEAWLDFIPVAILSALIVPSLITAGNPRHLDLFTSELIVAIPTFLFALKTKSLAGTVLLGMALFWLSGKIFG